MTKNMLVIYVLQFLGLIVNGVRQKPYNRPDNQYGSVNRGSGSAKFNPRSFFAALANSAERDLTVKPVASKPPEDVFTVTNKDMLRGSVPTKESPQLQQQHQRHRTAERHSENSVKGKIPVTENKVEYNFDFTEKYEKQSDQSLINVKGNLRKKIIILEKCSFS